MTTTLTDLLAEYDRSLAYTASLIGGLSDEQILWRPHADSSAIGWHLGHQAVVAHFMIRNLTAAEPSPDPELDALMDSATAERDRGDLPDVPRILAYREAIAERVHHWIGRIDEGKTGAPNQLRMIAGNLMTAVVNHEYQHSTWIGEVRERDHGLDLPPAAESPLLTVVDGYTILRTS
ncbi:MAG: DinB family protein [Actinomycetota bacterium]